MYTVTMRNKHLVQVTMEEWIKNTSYRLVQQNFDIVKEFAKNYELVVLNKLMSVFVGHLIEVTVSYTLNENLPDLLDKTGKYERVSKNFKDLKAMMQIHVADGFSKALNEFADQNCEYYCEIKLSPEPTSRLNN